MVRDPTVAGPDASALELARTMAEKRIGSVIITDSNKPVGIVTERDLVRRVLALSKDPTHLTAINICSKPVITCAEKGDVARARPSLSLWDVFLKGLHRHRIPSPL